MNGSETDSFQRKLERLRDEEQAQLNAMRLLGYPESLKGKQEERPTDICPHSQYGYCRACVRELQRDKERLDWLESHPEELRRCTFVASVIGFRHALAVVGLAFTSRGNVSVTNTGRASRRITASFSRRLRRDFQEKPMSRFFVPPFLLSYGSQPLRFSTRSNSILTPSHTYTNSHAPGIECGIMGPHPIALYGSHNSQRIVAQRGAFVIFGKNVQPMETIHETQHFPRASLKKLLLRRDKIASLLEAITLHGITDSVVFPDLDGLAREMKREFLFSI